MRKENLKKKKRKEKYYKYNDIERYVDIYNVKYNIFL